MIRITSFSSINAIISLMVEERPSQVEYDGIQDGDKHFLDEFDDTKKSEVLQIFWKELWPKLYALGWREQVR